MANWEHLDILEQGVDVWNEWREKHIDSIEPDLSKADLREADLREVDFSKANLNDAKLSGADLRKSKFRRALLWGANLRGANLSEASFPTATIRAASLSGANFYKAILMEVNFWESDLSEANLKEAYLYDALFFGANLRRADLSEADLSNALFRETDLSEANLSNANLFQTDFIRANLSQADFSGAYSAYTVFENVDLSDVKGLEALVHRGPSSIGIDTIYRSKGNIPENFLKGAGVDDTFITYIHALAGKAIEYYSCFISYASHDQDFAERLHADLQSKGVRCWFAPEDMKIGDKIRLRIDEAIRIHDKLLLVLSENSVESAWVEKEVETAFEKERLQNRVVLFPIRLDNAVMSTTQAWAADIRRSRHIGNFSNWKQHNHYQTAFVRLLRDLKAEPPHRL